MYVWRMQHRVFKFFFSHPFFASGISLWESALHDEWGVYDAETGRAAQLPSQGGGWSRWAAEALHDATESRKKGQKKRWRFFFKVTKTRFGAKNALLDPLGDATSASESKHLWVCFQLKEVGCFFLFFLTWLLQALKDKFAIVSLNCSGVRERREDLRP